MRGLLNFAKRKPLPVRDPVQARVPELRDANLAAVYYGQRMAGDFYDFIRVGPTRVLFGLLDVAGRMEDTREIASAAQRTFRTLGTALFTKEDVNQAEAMVTLCLELNRTVLQTAGKVHSCPAFTGCYDESLGTVWYFNAGHTPGLVRDQAGLVELPATGLPLGLFSHTTANASTVALQPGAVLLLVSRGIVEAQCGGEEFGLEQVKAGFQRSQAASAKELCLSILDQVQQFMCTPPTHNDVTALALFRAATSKAVSATNS